MPRFPSPVLVALGLVLLTTSEASAQSFGKPSTPRFGAGTPAWGGGEAAAYLPYGSLGGGFLPYSGGPGGGLGVQPRGSMPSTPARTMTLMRDASRPRIGGVRSSFAPLAPIRRDASGMGAGMGTTTGLRWSAPTTEMNRMARPPVGSLPFRQPPSLLAPATAGPSMSM